MNILLMDDEDQVLGVTTRMLEFLGHKVTGVTDGREVLHLYRENIGKGVKFDFVILDIQVKRGLNGRETLQALFEIDPEVRVAAMSGFSDDASRSEYLRLGFKWLIPKPLSLEELKAALLDIRHVLKKKN